MTDEYQLQLTPNGYGAQPYFSRDLLEDSACPLSQGDEVIARAIRGVGVLLVDADDDPQRYEVSDGGD